jgi:hypothetical protein
MALPEPLGHVRMSPLASLLSSTWFLDHFLQELIRVSKYLAFNVSEPSLLDIGPPEILFVVKCRVPGVVEI